MNGNRERIADFISRFPGRDDDEISKALRISPRQAVNQICRSLEKAGAIQRKAGPSGKLVNYPVIANACKPAAKAVVQTQPTVVDIPADWFWEGNVTDVLAVQLKELGWIIKSQADAGIKQRGLDLHAERNGIDLVIEVKGYPSTTYRDPRRSTEKKPTNPTNQAQQWYSHALLKALRLKNSHPRSLVAMAFPDFPRYRALFDETKTSLQKIGVGVFFVGEGGALIWHGLDASVLH